MTLPATPHREFVTGLPKSELHVHLEGTLEPALKLRLAERNGIDIGQRSVAEVEATYRFDSLTSFLGVYYPAMDVLRTQQDFRELAGDYCSSTRRRTRPAASPSRMSSPAITWLRPTPPTSASTPT
jgi:adenosine deaminase